MRDVAQACVYPQRASAGSQPYPCGHVPKYTEKPLPFGPESCGFYVIPLLPGGAGTSCADATLEGEPPWPQDERFGIGRPTQTSEDVVCTNAAFYSIRRVRRCLHSGSPLAIV